ALLASQLAHLGWWKAVQSREFEPTELNSPCASVASHNIPQRPKSWLPELRTLFSCRFRRTALHLPLEKRKTMVGTQARWSRRMVPWRVQALPPYPSQTLDRPSRSSCYQSLAAPIAFRVSSALRQIPGLALPWQQVAMVIPSK